MYGFSTLKFLLISFLIIAPIAAVVSYKSEEKISDYSSNHLDDMKNMKGYLLDSNNLSKEEMFLEDKQLPPIKDSFKGFFTNLIKKVRYESVSYNIFVYGTLNMAITLTTIISIILIIKCKRTPGSYAAVSIYISSLWDPMLDTFNTRREYVSGKPAMDSYYEFINMTPVTFDKSKIKSLEIRDYTSLGSRGEKLHQAFSQTIEKGKINLIVGDNGIGKTTTIKAVVGIHDFENGSITIDGHSIKEEPVICKKIMAYIPDNPDLYEHLTGFQYINFIADLFEVSTEIRRERIQRYGDLFEMTKHLSGMISSYSHGMKQRTAIISALVHSPKLLILDEPFVGLDPKATFLLKKIMHECVSDGGAIFFSTHVLDVAEKLCNKIAIIKNGKLIASGNTEEVKGNKSLETFFMEVQDNEQNLDTN